MQERLPPRPLLSVDDLTVDRGGRIVLSRLSFALDAGEVVRVSGRNGAGKSTLLRTVGGFLQPTGGRIAFADATVDVRGVETAHYLGYEDALKPSLTVGENLAFWASMYTPSVERRVSRTHERDAVRTALAAFGMARLVDLRAGYLSAGQKRRVALARLLIATRPIWLLDEPLIALDGDAQTALTQMMLRHVGTGGAVLVASHQDLALPHRRIDLDAVPLGPIAA